MKSDLKADDKLAPQPDHTPDEHLPPLAPIVAPDPPDPERVPAMALGVMGDLVALFEQLTDQPMGHTLSGRVVALRRNYDLLVFHSKLPEPKP